MGILVRRFMTVAMVLAFSIVLTGIGGAAVPTAVAANTADSAVVTALDRDGRYLESSDGAVEAAVDDANRDGIAFVWLDQAGDLGEAERLADDYVLGLENLGSEFHTVLVLTSDAYAAISTVYSDAEVERALDSSFQSFSSGSASRGIQAFTASLQGAALAGDSGTTADQTTTTSGSQNGNGSSDGGIGFGTILLAILALGGGFLLFRSWSGRRKAKEQAAIDLEEDRIEIEEQLKNNADRVISLGDRVIASGDNALIDLYEDASQTYQQVSQSIDGTDTADGIDALDDQIDHAEWQFEVIEAKLDGRPAPPKPLDDDVEAIGPEDKPAPPPPVPSNQRDRSVITSPTTGRDYSRPSRTQQRAPRQRRRGGLGGGGLGGILGGVLGNIILGGGLGGGSRRTNRRSGGMGLPGLGGNRSTRSTSGTGSLGGGVLRRGGGSSPARSRSTTRARTRPTRRTRSTRGGGGRSLGKRRGGGRKL